MGAGVATASHPHPVPLPEGEEQGDGAELSPPPRARRFADLRKRILSALILGPLAIAAVWAGAWPFKVMIAASAAVLAWEWVHLRGLMTRRWPGMVVPGVLLLACLAAALETPALALAALAVGFALALAAAPRAGRPGAGRRWLAAGVPYVGIGCIALVGLRGDGSAGLSNVLFLIAIVWASDIGAYAAGRLLGGPKLAPAISPSKTWAGALGGLLAAMLAGLAVARSVGPAETLAVALVAGLLGAASQAGDLLESWIKRRCQVKDSSRLIPGHGGLLDRVDGLLAAAPVAGALALALGPGVHLWHIG
jgi:phosphatidate cytidylyltransferase